MAFLFGLLWGNCNSSCISNGDPSNGRDNGDVTSATLSNAILKYTLKQYKEMVANEKTKTENIFTSPYSIWSSLALAYLGARGESSEELKTLLGLEGLKKSAVEEQNKVLGNAVQSKNGDVFLVANKIAFDEQNVRLRQCVVSMRPLKSISTNPEALVQML